MPIITLTTDFGTRDGFVGTLKGVIATLAPDVRVIDITHDIPPGDIRAGAFVLANAARFFPRGAVHVAVVDPGVGSPRRAIALRTAGAIFVGPDNGLLSWAVRDATVEDARELTNESWFLHPVSHTFHGRDVFAPVAARLAAGAAFALAGEPIDNLMRLPWPLVASNERGCTGEVMHVDRFGNAITNIPIATVPEDAVRRDTVEIRLSGARSMPFGDFYGSVAPGQAIAVAGSSGLIELAVNGGNASRELALRPGEPVAVVWERAALAGCRGIRTR